MSSKTKPAISVIIPVYNVEHYLRQSLDGVTAQTLTNIEIICVNDGSPDNCLEILREYEKKDPRIIIISREENRGAGFSRNEGLNAAGGEFVIFMDPDDWYPSENNLFELYTCAARNKIMVCGGSLSTYKDNEVNCQEYPYSFDNEGIMEYAEYQFPFFYQRFLFNREMLIANDIYFPECKRFQDVPFMIKAMIAAGKFYAIRSSVYMYRVNNKTADFGDDIIADILKEYAECLNLSREHNLKNLHIFIMNLLINDHYPAVKNLQSNNFKVHSAFIEALLSADPGMLGSDSAPLCLYNFFLNNETCAIELSDIMDLASMDALLKWLQDIERNINGTAPLCRHVPIPRLRAYKSIFSVYKNILISHGIYDYVEDNFMKLAKKYHTYSL